MKNDNDEPEAIRRKLSSSKDDTDTTVAVSSEAGDTTSVTSITPADSAAASDLEEEEESLQATREMCAHCFDILLRELMSSSPNNKHHHHKHGILSHLFGSSPNAKKSSSTWVLTDFVSGLPDAQAMCPLFVTWDKLQLRGGGQYELRGCIGTLSPRPLRLAVGEYAIVSALQDRRFHPIRLSEVPQLRVAVSLLVKYEDVGSNVYDWTVGTHGIVLKFTASRGTSYSATYLPEVALEQGWTQEEAVESLVRKAGYHGHVTPDFVVKSNMTCTRYQSSKLRMTYQEYVRQRHQGIDPLETEDRGGK